MTPHPFTVHKKAPRKGLTKLLTDLKTSFHSRLVFFEAHSSESVCVCVCECMSREALPVAVMVQGGAETFN